MTAAFEICQNSAEYLPLETPDFRVNFILVRGRPGADRGPKQLPNEDIGPIRGVEIRAEGDLTLLELQEVLFC